MSFILKKLVSVILRDTAKNKKRYFNSHYICFTVLFKLLSLWIILHLLLLVLMAWLKGELMLNLI